MTEKEQVKEYYDGYIDHQQKIGISVRHRLIHQGLKQLKLAKSTNVLEVGCGIGTVSMLITETFNEGQFVGCDISEKSIETAKRFIQKSNVQFICTDMSDFTHNVKFDLVVFPDVLEHIPQDQHLNLFQKISATCSADCIWYINIPNPDVITYHREHNPHLLQIIDQALDISRLIHEAQSVGFKIEHLEKYAIHTDQPNYMRLILKNDTRITKLSLRSKVSMAIQNISARF